MPQKCCSYGATLAKATCNVHTMGDSLLGRGHVSMGDPHQHHRAGEAVDCSSQDRANPALGQTKGGVRDRADGLENILTCNKGSEGCMALGKHPCVTADA